MQLNTMNPNIRTNFKSVKVTLKNTKAMSSDMKMQEDTTLKANGFTVKGYSKLKGDIRDSDYYKNYFIITHPDKQKERKLNMVIKEDINKNKNSKDYPYKESEFIDDTPKKSSLSRRIEEEFNPPESDYP